MGTSVAKKGFNMNCHKNERPMKKHCVLCLAFLLIVFAFTRVGFSKDVVRLYFFYSDRERERLHHGRK